MEPEFQIKPGNPQTTQIFDPEDESLCDAVQTAFEMTTERAVMMWKGIPISLGYKYDVSFLVEDAIRILKALVAEEAGTCSNSWPSNTFLCTWNLAWRGDELRVKSEWLDVGNSPDAPPLLPRLKANPEIRVSRAVFVREWMGLLRTVCDCLLACRVSSSILQPLMTILAADSDNQW